jgi:hypothetical protein
MHIDLVDSLRCVREHPPTWLVARLDAVSGRDIRYGALGCPVCHAEYAIHDGIADFRTDPLGPAATRGRDDTADAGPMTTSAWRAAALLDLTRPGGFIILAGAWARTAPTLLDLVDGVDVLALNAPPGMQRSHRLSLAVADDDVPVRPATTRGVALDAPHATPRRLTAAAAALRPHGRLLFPSATAAPRGLTVLARDQWHAVGEKVPDDIVVLRAARDQDA